jgi:hypothetical protein
MGKITKYEQEFINTAKSLSNKDLLDSVLELATGDDYDGCFTTRGWNRYNIYVEELESRLSSWLEQ